VAAVRGVPVPVVDVVDVVAVRNGDVAAAFPVLVRVLGVLGVAAALALFRSPVVHDVQVALVRIVDVVAVRDGDVAAARTVRVAGVVVRHCSPPE
jgi:hypothetical protein